MFKKQLSLTILLLLTVFSLFSQKETCNSPEDDGLVDLNSITKCTVEDVKDGQTKNNSKKLSVQVSSKRRRIVRRKGTSTSLTGSSKLAALKNKTSLVENLDLTSNKTAEKLPFSFVEEKPLFDSCKDVAILEQEKCFKSEIQKHIKRNFKYPTKSYNASIQGRVLVQFVIDENGDVNDIFTRGPLKGEELEEEAKRIVRKLPKFSAGKINGKKIKVKYGFPISFKIPGKAPSNVASKAKKVDLKKLGKVINFNNVNKIPTFSECSKKGDTSSNCFNKSMIRHIQKHFAYPSEAAQQNIEGRVFVIFIIDTEGQVINIQTKGPQNGKVLEKSARKVIEKLPKFIPAKHEGKPANVKYVIPISYKLND